MTAYSVAWQRAALALLRQGLLLAALAFAAGPARADDKAQIIATAEPGYGRLVMSFPDRTDLPDYRVKFENGVLALEFNEPLSIVLPDISLALPDYVTVARIDADRRGLRLGLRNAVNVNRIEAGEKLFIDVLPASWQGVPPALPPEVVEQLAEQARQAAARAEEDRRIEEAKRIKPAVEVRVGRAPTFIRVEFDWNTDTAARFEQVEKAGYLDFDWPVPIDLHVLEGDLPPEIAAASNSVGRAGSRVEFALAEGVAPRFYEASPRQFILDFDIAPEDGVKAAIAAEELVEQMRQAAAAAARQQRTAAAGEDSAEEAPADPTAVVVPQVTNVGNTVRLHFPFAANTAAAVFRRGNVVWMLFDTPQTIAAPAGDGPLAAVASAFEVVPAGDTKIVRMVMTDERLATLGSEGKAWVLSLGDVLLGVTEPLPLSRHRGPDGGYEVAADVQRVGRLHDFRDPDVGDMLDVVTVFPPARGVARELGYVDFRALRSVHGLVVKPISEGLAVTLDGTSALIRRDDGLTVSPLDVNPVADGKEAPEFRASYLDFAPWREDNPAALVTRREALSGRAAETEGRLRDVARLDLAQFYLANEYAHEAIGVLRLLDKQLKTEDLRKKVSLMQGIANTLARRPKEAIAVLGKPGFTDEVDAVMWRAIAKAEAGDFPGGRTDTLAAEGVADAYPTWIRNRFMLAGLRSAVESGDATLALRLVGRVDFSKLDAEQVTTYHLMQGRIAELQGRNQEAIDIYGQVIAADIRPTRPEAIYRTLALLDKEGRIDLDQATRTLAAEALMWRGNSLEADMQKLLAELYFRNHDYASGFAAVKQAVAYYPESRSIGILQAEAQQVFEDLYLNGRADELSDVEALSVFYDFRELTPAGSRGDEMIRNLARRLVKVDLLNQAGDLLEYQVNTRLSGAGKAQVAADLAVIRIADRQPEAALRVLQSTRIAELPPMLERQRRILQARALIDAGRQELALDLISKLEGRDADLLRVDGYWRSKHYGAAAALLEVLNAPPADGTQMVREMRLNVLKAAVGFVMEGDTVGLSRLRSKFTAQMANSAEWPLFDFVTRDSSPQSAEFRQALREISGLDPLEAFLAAYRAEYGTAGLAPKAPRPNAA